LKYLKSKPVSIENRWDILYRDYPEVYDEFASYPYDPPMTEVIHEMFDLSGKTIVDVGSGSGLSTFPLAKFAKTVIGIEPERAMRELAEKRILELGLSNVRLIEGHAESIALDDDSTDMLTAFFATLYPPNEAVPKFIAEASRIVKPGGLILTVDVAPGWYGGELADIIGDEDADADTLAKHRAYVKDAGFSFKDIDQVQDYCSLDNIVGTYGFIFGRKTIDHLRANNKTTVKWRFRMFYKNL
jgi:ubiquinone/menaquinone biosynthesis C-methylase UbiE